jgi:hypothetical protein
MATFNEQLLKIVEDYRASGAPWPATKCLTEKGLSDFSEL